MTIISQVHLDHNFASYKKPTRKSYCTIRYPQTSHIQSPSSNRSHDSNPHLSVPRSPVTKLARNFHNLYNSTNAGNLPQNSSGSSLIGALSLPGQKARVTVGGEGGGGGSLSNCLLTGVTDRCSSFIDIRESDTSKGHEGNFPILKARCLILIGVRVIESSGWIRCWGRVRWTTVM
jgi:hypothetical protein